MSSSKIPTPSAELLNQLIPRYAGFVKRAAAMTADFAVMNVTLVLVQWRLGWDWLAEPEEAAAWRFPLAVMLGIPALYEAVLTASPMQGTPGKAYLKLYVCDLKGRRLSFGRALLRHAAKYVSLASLMVGFFIQPFSYRKQALHDMIAGTIVRER